jgi:hypothetical protein
MKAIDQGGWAAQLRPGERLLWEGAPAQAMPFAWSTALEIAVGLLVAGFGVAFLASAPQGQASWLEGREIGLFALVGGLYLAFGRRAWLRFERRCTRYALTDNRALIATRHWGRRLRSFPITPQTALDYYPGELATIIFARERPRFVVRHASGPAFDRETEVTEIGFEAIPDGERVMALLNAIQSGASPAEDRS